MTFRISLDDSTDNLLRSLAVKRKTSTDDLAALFILAGIEDARHPALRFLTTTVNFVATILIIIWLLSIPIPKAVNAPELLHWFRDLVSLFVPWPLTILVALWIVARSESASWLILGIFSSLRRIKLFGAEIELTEQSKRKIQIATSEIDSALRDYKDRVDNELKRIVAKHQIERMLSLFIESETVKSFIQNRNSFRCTIHIPDPIRYGQLYQLVDYCPQGSGRTRAFSIRYGIIGRVWRTEKIELENDLLPQKTPQRTHEEEIEEVMSTWGMNWREAESALTHRSYCCFPLTEGSTKLGLLYMDATDRGAFADERKNEVAAKAESDIAPIVAKVLGDSATIALQLDLD